MRIYGNSGGLFEGGGLLTICSSRVGDYTGVEGGGGAIRGFTVLQTECQLDSSLRDLFTFNFRFLTKSVHLLYSFLYLFYARCHSCHVNGRL